MRKLWELVLRLGNWCKNHKAITAFVFASLILIVPLDYAFAVDSELFTKFITNPIDVIALTLAGIIQIITGGIGKIILLIIEMIVIPVLGYNGFYNSHITNLGWSLVRDVVNMFVVVVLMVIAIMTIVGHSKANWTQQLPRLFIAIVLVNFSKLVCGFLIDVSQVIMFTFVNAIVSIAAGNFAAMFSLNSFGQLNADFIDKINATGIGLGAFQFLMGAYLQFVVTLGILGVMFLLAIAFVWRIVVLWILIIMSPLAFFLGGIKDVFGAAGKGYEEWWSKFTSALTFGPVMVFFLWLALAASSGSNLARTEDFPMPEAKNSADLSLEMFSIDNFLGMFLALAILIAGMQQASQSAAALGGFASKMLSEGVGTGMLKGLARPMSSAKKLSRGAASQLAKPRDLPFGLDNLRQGMVEKGAKGMANIGSKIQGIKGLGFAGSAISSLGGFAAAKAGEGRTEKNKAGADEAKYQTQTDEQKATFHRRLTDGTAAVRNADGTIKYGEDGKPVRKSPNTQPYQDMTEDEQMASRRKFLTNPDERKKIEKETKKKHQDAGITDEKLLAAAVKNDMDDLTANNIEFAESDEGKRKLALDDNDKKLVAGMKMENLHLVEPPKGVPKPGQSGYNKANYDAAKQKAMKEAIDATDGYSHKIHGARALGDENVRAVLGGVSSGRQTADGTPITALEDLRTQGTFAQKDALRNSISSEEISTRSDALADVVGGGVMAPNSEGKYAPGFSRDGDHSKADAVVSAVSSVDPDAVVPQVHGNAAGALLDMGYGTDQVFGGDVVDPSNGTRRSFDAAARLGGEALDAGQRARAGAMVEANHANAAHLAQYIPEGTPANEMTHLVANSVNKEGIKKLQTGLTTETNPAKLQQKRDALDAIARSVKAERAHAVTTGGEKSDRAKKMKTLDDQINESGVGRYGSRSASPAPAPAAPARPRRTAEERRTSAEAARAAAVAEGAAQERAASEARRRTALDARNEARRAAAAARSAGGGDPFRDPSAPTGPAPAPGGDPFGS